MLIFFGEANMGKIKKILMYLVIFQCVLLLGCGNNPDAKRGKELAEKYPMYSQISDFKGIEVNVWEDEKGNYICAALSGTNRAKSNEEWEAMKEYAIPLSDMRLIFMQREEYPQIGALFCGSEDTTMLEQHCKSKKLSEYFNDPKVGEDILYDIDYSEFCEKWDGSPITLYEIDPENLNKEIPPKKVYLEEYPNACFHPQQMYVKRDGENEDVIYARHWELAPISQLYGSYLYDVTGDGAPESVLFYVGGSGLFISQFFVYDFVEDKYYEHRPPMYTYIRCIDNELKITLEDGYGNIGGALDIDLSMFDEIEK